MSSEIIVSEQYNRAVMLNRSIVANAQAAQASLYEVCKGLKEMRDDKLYKELGYQNFEEYAENEVGMTKRNANRYVSIADMFAESGTPVSQNLGMTKLSLLATLSESDREEIIENNDVSEMSKRELEEKIKEIKMLNKEKSELAALNDSLLNANKTLRANSDKQSEVIDELETKVEELENRPIDMTVADNSHEIENMRKAMAKMGADEERKYRQLEEDSIKSERKLHQEYQAKIQEYEEKLKSASAPAEITDDKEVFKTYLANTIDATKRLLDYVGKHPNELYTAKIKAYLANTIDATKRLLDYVGKHPNELYTAKIKSFFETTLIEIGG